MFHLDNANIHTYLSTRRKLLEIGWKIRAYFQYNPDLAPSDRYLVQRVQNSLSRKNFANDDQLKSHVTQLFQEKKPDVVRGRDRDITREMTKYNPSKV